MLLIWPSPLSVRAVHLGLRTRLQYINEMKPQATTILSLSLLTRQCPSLFSPAGVTPLSSLPHHSQCRQQGLRAQRWGRGVCSDGGWSCALGVAPAAAADPVSAGPSGDDARAGLHWIRRAQTPSPIRWV